ncbi:MAG: hypothetical protein B6D56_07200 [Candidatus Omnitrophica bacterium 4484_70.1]|nr:MAG: hypothetical protein B6D56_07200 [Candidatus Omnitrophica bacterium 4484_70.1]
MIEKKFTSHCRSNSSVKFPYIHKIQKIKILVLILGFNFNLRGDLKNPYLISTFSLFEIIFLLIKFV